MAAVRSFETSLTVYQTTWRRTSEDNNLHSRRHDNLIAHVCKYACICLLIYFILLVSLKQLGKNLLSTLFSYFVLILIYLILL
jgi:hypothetical protein